MAIGGGIIAGGLQTLIVLFVWKKYGIEIAGWQNIKQKMALIICLVLLSLLGCLLFMGKNPIITCIHFLVFHTILLAISGIDYKQKIIPNKLLIAGMGARTIFLLAEFVFYQDTFWRVLFNSLVGMAFGFGLMLVLCWISKHGIGFGDVKLFAWIGYCVGLNDTYSILFYSALIAAVAGTYLLIIKKESRKKAIPFGPFVWAGAYVVDLLLLL